jgi:mono/diheme cytochrome c family protein
MRRAAALLLLGVCTVAGAETSAERGKYLALAGDCIGCHTAEDGADYAGGLGLATPYGTLYSTNITPDKETGIGGYSKDEFFRVMNEGIAADGHRLYPAMPFTSYHLVTRADSDAIFDFLMSLPAVRRENTPSGMAWPFSMRVSLIFWDWLYADREPFEPTPGKSEQWNRGAYLVNGLGHCGECHTPRNKLGAMISEQALAGGNLGVFQAPDIRSVALRDKGWTTDGLVTYLKQGQSDSGLAFGEMFTVVSHSTRHLSAADLEAISAYLLDGEVEEAADRRRPDLTPELESQLAGGRQAYLDLCAGCHGSDGEGIPAVTPPLSHNAVVAADDPYNLIKVSLVGIAGELLGRAAAWESMPGFSTQLSNEQLAQLVNYMRVQWGRRQPSVTAAEVLKIRQEG